MRKILKGRLLAGAGNTHPLKVEAINKGWKPSRENSEATATKAVRSLQAPMLASNDKE